MNAPDFTEATYKYLATANLAKRKETGQYFTPRPIREHLLNQLPRGIKSPKVLDPGCGTGEFLLSAKNYFKNPILEGWDIDPLVLKAARENISCGTLKKCDALLAEKKETFDFVIGNPPYFEFSPSKELRERYSEIIKGRVNIFSLFVKLGLDLLKPGGHLAYVIPPSMNNGAYFSALREYIVKNADITYLKVLQETDLFIDALQMTMVLVLKKSPNTGKYIFEHNGIKIFSEDYNYLKNKFKGSSSLMDFGFTVKTGRVVWNQNKEKLTNEAKGAIPLIWAHNITPNGLEIPTKNKRSVEKKYQYIKGINPDCGPAIVVNRITGASKSAKIRAAIVPEGMPFLAENHCNVIFPPKSLAQSNLFSGPLKKLPLDKILEQLHSGDNLRVMQSITGNTQVSKTELEKLFPLHF